MILKKQVSLLLALALLMAVCGCTQPQMSSPGSFYYKCAQPQFDAENSVIQAEQRELAEVHDDMKQMLELYLLGPQDPSLVSPFPRNTHVVDASIGNQTLYLTLSEEFAQLSGVDLTIACGCITRTAAALFPIDQVHFQVEGASQSGSSFTMSPDHLQLIDDSLERLMTAVTVYYSDAQRRYLVGKQVSINLAEESNVVEYLIDQLCHPPKDSDLLSPLPEGSRVLSVSTENKVCKVNFSSEFDHKVWRDAQAQRLSLLSVVNTLTQLPQIEYVEFYSEGNLITQYRLLTVSGPLARDERAIGPVRSGVNEFDASLYLCNGANEYLVCVPTKLRQSVGMSPAELVVQELISYQKINGFSSPVPKDTSIRSISVEDGVCRLDLSEAFLQNPAQVPLALRSIIASLCALEEVEQVFVTVEGTVPVGDLAPYFRSTVVDPTWIT